MQSFKKIINLTGIAVFVASFIVYFMSAERTGSLWDCGEFILGAYKLQVVHPPGAGLFVLIGRMFTWVADMVSDNQSDIAFSVNLMSSLCSALAAMFIGWVTMLMAKVAWVGRSDEPTPAMNLALAFAGLAAGLSSAFITSVWFSAVEGEVYAMSTFFTALTVWAAVKWYHLPESPDSDRWLIFSLFVAGLSIGVHLLSLLAFPAIAMLYYYKKYENKSIVGLGISILIGGLGIAFIQKLVIVGIPSLWQSMELFTVNSLGLPFHSGLVPALLIVAGLCWLVLRTAQRRGSQLLQNLGIAATLIIISYSTIGVVVIRANADTPVNMNTPSDAMRLIPYLNREQYGERPLLKGPHYLAQPSNVERSPRYGRVGNEYKIVDEKFDYVWKNSDKILFPRIGHQDKADLHQQYKEYLTGRGEGKPDFAYNISYFRHYQLRYMYWRYFMWNFTGRQNSDQGTGPWNKKDGNWISGIDAFDDARTYEDDLAPDTIQENPSKNHYYFIPLLLGLLGMVFHFNKSRKDFLALLMLFFTTGIGIIIYSNQPPIEPRERDYVLVGSFITFCIWIGFGVLALFDILSKNIKLPSLPSAAIAGVIGLASPFLLLTQNFDDHDRSHHYASRDYAANFLNSLEKDAIIFTYGDNDTYPLWYAQEVENIRRDVRVVNLSLIQVDWYINKLRKKVNESAPIKMTIPQDSYDGKNLNQVFFGETTNPQRVNLMDILKTLAIETKKADGYPSLSFKNYYIPVKATQGLFELDSLAVLDSIPVNIPEASRYLTKDDIAILDLIASNINERPVYFSVTCKNDKLQGLNDFMQLEGLGLRIIPAYNRSDRAFSIYGSGRVATDKLYKHVIEDWKWGNFDKIKTHIDKSYLAEIQAMKLAMLRGAYAFVAKRDSTKAADLANKYFEVFPHMNFPYDAGIVPFLNVLINAGDFESAKKHIAILAEETKQFGDFYQTLDADDIMSFSQDIDLSAQAAGDVKELSTKVQDPAFEKEMRDKIGDLDTKLNGMYQRLRGEQ
ncbi:MAG: DUF2723 domain-containing protein [Saprospiraceae bacterium]|nr:DUF2723 domain-containing protein [Saprospiraceae bacterium]